MDTYDTLRGVDRVIALVRDEGLDVGAVRIDSGDLGELAGEARRKLDAAGLQRVRIVVSGGLDEHRHAAQESSMYSLRRMRRGHPPK